MISHGVARIALIVAGCLCVSAAAVAQAPPPDLVTPPANILLPNYNNVPIGPNAGLEGSAHVARVGDPSAAWLNPAGLSRAESAEVSGSSGLFQLATVSPSTLPNNGGSVTQLPSLVGFTATNVGRKGLTAGLSFLTSSSWSQETDSQIVVNQGSTAERFGYSADAEYQQHVGAGSVGWASGRLRLGGGLAFLYTSITKNGVVSDRLATPTNLRSFLLESRVTGSAFQLRPLFGAQFDLSPHVAIGGMMRTRPITLFTSAVTTSDGIAQNGSVSSAASFFDDSAQFTNRLPFEFHGGIAFTGSRGEIEVDVQAYTPVSAYTIIASAQPIVTYGSAGSGSAPVVVTQPFNGITSHMRGMANVAAGGRFLLTSSGVWRLHFGAGSDLSPVADDDQVFTKVNMFTWSVGLSGTKGPLQFAAGLNWRSGSSDNVIVRDLQNGDRVRSGVDVRTVGLIYSLSYKF
jgi:hypothetical protein